MMRSTVLLLAFAVLPGLAAPLEDSSTDRLLHLRSTVSAEPESLPHWHSLDAPQTSGLVRRATHNNEMGWRWVQEKNGLLHWVEMNDDVYQQLERGERRLWAYDHPNWRRVLSRDGERQRYGLPVRCYYHFCCTAGAVASD